METELLAKSQQENLLCLLCYSKPNSSFIRNAVAIELFEPPYREVVRRVYGYIDSYSENPGDHVADLLEDVLADPAKKLTYTRVMEGLVASKGTVSVKYTLDKLEKFIRQQNFKAGIIEAAEGLQSEADPNLDEIESGLLKRMKSRLSLFNPGLSMRNEQDIIRFFNRIDEPCFPTGIPIFDRTGLGPIRGGLHVMIGAAKTGKSHWFVNLGRQSILQGFKVAVLTLEMSEDLYMQRFIQSMCGLTKETTRVNIPKFIMDALGNVNEIQVNQVNTAFGLRDPRAIKAVRDKWSKWKDRRRNLIIKQFPTGQLTIHGIRAYLDRLEEANNFIPDLLILDYADLMQLDAANLRTSTGQIYKDLRGLAVERDIAVATASQSNREGAKKRVGSTSVAEDWSKIGTADTVFAYNQSPFEHRLGIGRVSVEAARNDVDKFEIAIAQNYAMCQYVRDSIMVSGVYHDIVKTMSDQEDDGT